MRDDWFITASGKRVFVREPHRDQICIEDIAHALSHICRFGGHSREFYSVAQHSVLVSEIVPRSLARAGLLHDAAEAYLGDVIRPLKREIASAYKPLEDAWELVVCEAFGVDIADMKHPEVKRADMIALATERRDLVNPTALQNFGGEWIKDEKRIGPLPIDLVAAEPSLAREMFLRRYLALS